MTFPLAEKREVWTDDAPRLYAQAARAQWDPATAIDWGAPLGHPSFLEDAVVQVMTYLIENETAALMVPVRFLAQIHPHFREILQVMAIQAADEARHIEVFTRRAALGAGRLGVSSVRGRTSLQTLFVLADFAETSLLLSVLGEGTFLGLLHFLEACGPDPITRAAVRLAAQDEARHVAFALACLRRHAGEDPRLTTRLARAIEQRHDSLAGGGLGEEVFESLVLLAAGDLSPAAIGRGHARVMRLLTDMQDDCRARLARIGFSASEADRLGGLHTQNLM